MHRYDCFNIFIIYTEVNNFWLAFEQSALSLSLSLYIYIYIYISPLYCGNYHKINCRLLIKPENSVVDHGAEQLQMY